MHDSAYHTAGKFFAEYGSQARVIVEVGSRNVNGELRVLKPEKAFWIGLDRIDGPGVDIQVGVDIPLADGLADVTVTANSLEHDRFFWNTFAEMARVTAIDGYILVIAPMIWPLHKEPVDCWRFQPDAALALVAWAEECGYDVILIETGTNEAGSGRDFWAIYQRTDA